MIINELEGFYGKATEDEKQWVAVNLENLDADMQGKYLAELHKIHKDKFPDVSIMKNLLFRITGKKAREYYWAVCLECGCEYDYDLPMCPSCYDNGFECRAKAVKKSEFQPPAKVIRYNKKYLNGDKGEAICYSCIHKKEGYCKNFGNHKWACKREEYEMCECKSCCAIMKRANERYENSKAVHKFSYAIPLKKV